GHDSQINGQIVEKRCNRRHGIEEPSEFERYLPRAIDFLVSRLFQIFFVESLNSSLGIHNHVSLPLIMNGTTSTTLPFSPRTSWLRRQPNGSTDAHRIRLICLAFLGKDHFPVDCLPPNQYQVTHESANSGKQNKEELYQVLNRSILHRSGKKSRKGERHNR